MSAARQLTRTAPRFAAQLRTPMQRRFASTAENEFISERQHIKEHAQGTTGEYACSLSPPVAPSSLSSRCALVQLLIVPLDLWKKISL